MRELFERAVARGGRRYPRPPKTFLSLGMRTAGLCAQGDRGIRAHRLLWAGWATCASPLTGTLPPATRGERAFTAPRAPLTPVLCAGQHVLEVKFDELLPDQVAQVLELGSLQQTAFSKYYLSRLALPKPWRKGQRNMSFRDVI